MRTLVLLLFPFCCFSQSYDILFIGNSYTYYNDLPEMVSNIASSFGDSVTYDQSTPGGSSLYAHAQNQTTINFSKKISDISYYIITHIKQIYLGFAFQNH